MRKESILDPEFRKKTTAVGERGSQRPLGISSDYTMMVCSEIKRIRLELGWTQTDVSRATGYTQQHVSFMESGERRPYADVLFFLQRRLELMESFEARLKRVTTDRVPGRLKYIPKPPSEKRSRRRARAKNFRVFGRLEPNWWK